MQILCGCEECSINSFKRARLNASCRTVMKKVTADHDEVEIPLDGIRLNGLLNIPAQPKALVLFVHGSGSGRFSTRNQYVARQLNAVDVATLLFDLLTPEEDEIDEITREYRFDIPMLADRLVDVTQWCRSQEQLQNLKIGYFGASTGAGAALIASANLSTCVHAIVSRGGRPDLAAASLVHVTAPTLLIVGGYDTDVIKLNKQALSKLKCEKELVIVPEATHLFEEPGKLQEAARIAKEWFLDHFN
jgi:putative phosphoribosyl transferase